MAGRELVDLIEHQHRIAPAGLAHGLRDVSRQRADVRATVSANLCLIVHAAQAHAAELESDGLGDALTERGLAHTRRADETQYGTTALGIELAYREEFQDAALDLLESIMILVEYGARLVDVDGFRIDLRPRHRQQPVEVGSGHGVFGGAVRHALQALEFAPGLFGDFRRHARVLDRLLQIFELGRR